MNSQPVPSPSTPSEVGYRWFVLVMLTLVYTFNFIDRQILVILQEPIKAELSLSDAQLGLLTGFSFAVVYVCAGIPIAYLADRSNRRNIVAVSLAVWSSMTALSGMVSSYSQLVLARLGVGIGEAGGSPPAHSMLSDYFPPEQRGTALSFYSTGIYIGILLGFAGGGWVAESFGWRQAFFVIGMPGVVFAVLLAALVREPRRGRWEGGFIAPKATFSDTFSLLKERPAFWWIAFGCAFKSFVSYGNGNFFPSFLIRNHGMTIGDVGLYLGLISGLAGALGTFMGGFLGDRLGIVDKRWYVWVPLWGTLIALPPYAYILLGQNVDLILLILIPTTVLNTLYLGPSIAMCQGIVSPSMRAVASAVMFFILNMVGLGLGPLMVGVLSDLYVPIFGNDHLRYAMLTALVLGLIGVFCFWQGSRRLLDDIDVQARDSMDERAAQSAARSEA